MKKHMISSLIGASVLVLAAGAASAQSHWDHQPDAGYANDRDMGWRGDARHDGGMSIDARQERIAWRIDRGVQTGQLTRREAAYLRREAHQIARLAYDYRVNGLSGWERADLDRRLDRLSAMVRFDNHDREYGYGYGFQFRR